MLASITLSLADYGVIAGMLATFVGVPLAIFRAMLGSLDKRLKVKADTHVVAELVKAKADAHAVTELDKRLTRLQGDAVSKLDWLREVVTNRKKLDGIAEQVASLTGRIDERIGMGAAVQSIATSLKAMTEGKPYD